MRGPGPVTSLLGRVFATDSRCIWVLMAGSVVLVRFYFARGGVSWAGDGSLHLTYAALAARAIADGDLPIWTNYFAAGSPFLQFYGFLFFYVVGILELLVGNLNLSVKIVLAAGHVLSGVTMFAFLRLALRSRPAAFVGGLGFVLTFWHTQHVLIMGRLPLSLFYACLPLPFYCFERARIPGRVAPSVALGAMALAGLTSSIRDTRPGQRLSSHSTWACGWLVGAGPGAPGEPPAPLPSCCCSDSWQGPF